MTGGYQILDLGGINLVTNGTSVKVKGLYNLIEGTHKPKLVGNFSVDGVEKDSRYVVFGVNAGNYEGGLGYSGEGNVLYMTITQDDNVTVKNAY